MMAVRVGTSGFSYSGWKGSFYPDELGGSQMLAWYAERLPAVEINNTFYKTPSREVLASWAAKVPASFRFAFKAPRWFGSRRGMTDSASGAKAPLERLFGALDATSDKLGPLLVQLPLKKDVALLRDFVAALPPGRRVALDLRHASWRSDEVYAVLRARDVALCATEASGEPLETTSTASWGYFRLRKDRYGAGALDGWEARLRALKLEEAYVFFKHDETGRAAKLALAFQRRFAS